MIGSSLVCRLIPHRCLHLFVRWKVVLLLNAVPAAAAAVAVVLVALALKVPRNEDELLAPIVDILST